MNGSIIGINESVTMNKRTGKSRKSRKCIVRFYSHIDSSKTCDAKQTSMSLVRGVFVRPDSLATEQDERFVSLSDEEEDMSDEVQQPANPDDRIAADNAIEPGREGGDMVRLKARDNTWKVE